MKMAMKKRVPARGTLFLPISVQQAALLPVIVRRIVDFPGYLVLLRLAEHVVEFPDSRLNKYFHFFRVEGNSLLFQQCLGSLQCFIQLVRTVQSPPGLLHEGHRRSGNGTQAFSGAVRTLLADKIAQWNEKGLVGKAVRVMVVGIPNVGKSTFINRILGR